MMRAALALLALTVTASPALAQTPPAPAVIVTQGEAILKRAPDRAWLGIAIETRDARPAEARRRNAEHMTEVQDALKRAGVPADAIRTTGFSLSPEFDWDEGRSTLRGYVVRNQIEVRVDALETLPAVLDAANAPRNVALSITGPRFDLKDSSVPESEALKLAVESAMSRAEAIAAGARRSVGRVLRIEEHRLGVPGPVPMMMRAVAAAEASQTPITPGEIEVRAQVTLTVELQ